MFIDQHCKHWAYLSPCERLEIVIFSQEMPTVKDLEDFLRSAVAPNDEAPTSISAPFLFGDPQQAG